MENEKMVAINKQTLVSVYFYPLSHLAFMQFSNICS